jgi:hypothetical protein
MMSPRGMRAGKMRVKEGPARKQAHRTTKRVSLVRKTVCKMGKRAEEMAQREEIADMASTKVKALWKEECS